MLAIFAFLETSRFLFKKIMATKKYKNNKPAIEQDEEITNLVYADSDNKALNYIKRQKLNHYNLRYSFDILKTLFDHLSIHNLSHRSKPIRDFLKYKSIFVESNSNFIFLNKEKCYIAYFMLFLLFILAMIGTAIAGYIILSIAHLRYTEVIATNNIKTIIGLVIAFFIMSIGFVYFLCFSCIFIREAFSLHTAKKFRTTFNNFYKDKLYKKYKI